MVYKDGISNVMDKPFSIVYNALEGPPTPKTPKAFCIAIVLKYNLNQHRFSFENLKAMQRVAIEPLGGRGPTRPQNVSTMNEVVAFKVPSPLTMPLLCMQSNKKAKKGE